MEDSPADQLPSGGGKRDNDPLRAVTEWWESVSLGDGDQRGRRNVDLAEQQVSSRSRRSETSGAWYDGLLKPFSGLGGGSGEEEQTRRDEGRSRGNGAADGDEDSSGGMLTVFNAVRSSVSAAITGAYYPEAEEVDPALSSNASTDGGMISGTSRATSSTDSGSERDEASGVDGLLEVESQMVLPDPLGSARDAALRFRMPLMPGAPGDISAEEASAFVGTWRYVGPSNSFYKSYTISRQSSGKLVIREDARAGFLEKTEGGEWLQAELRSGDGRGELVGAVRVKIRDEALVSNFVKAGDTDWGRDVVGTTVEWKLPNPMQWIEYASGWQGEGSEKPAETGSSAGGANQAEAKEASLGTDASEPMADEEEAKIDLDSLPPPEAPGMEDVNLIVDVYIDARRAQVKENGAEGANRLMGLSGGRILATMAQEGWEVNDEDPQQGVYNLALPSVRYEVPGGVVSIPAPLFQTVVRDSFAKKGEYRERLQGDLVLTNGKDILKVEIGFPFRTTFSVSAAGWARSKIGWEGDEISVENSLKIGLSVPKVPGLASILEYFVKSYGAESTAQCATALAKGADVLKPEEALSDWLATGLGAVANQVEAAVGFAKPPAGSAGEEEAGAAAEKDMEEDLEAVSVQLPDEAWWSDNTEKMLSLPLNSDPDTPEPAVTNVVEGSGSPETVSAEASTSSTAAPVGEAPVQGRQDASAKQPPTSTEAAEERPEGPGGSETMDEGAAGSEAFAAGRSPEEAAEEDEAVEEPFPDAPGMEEATLVTQVDIPPVARAPVELGAEGTRRLVSRGSGAIINLMAQEGWVVNPVDPSRGIYEMLLPSVRQEALGSVVSIPAPRFLATLHDNPKFDVEKVDGYSEKFYGDLVLQNGKDILKVELGFPFNKTFSVSAAGWTRARVGFDGDSIVVSNYVEIGTKAPKVPGISSILSYFVKNYGTDSTTECADTLAAAADDLPESEDWIASGLDAVGQTFDSIRSQLPEMPQVDAQSHSVNTEDVRSVAANAKVEKTEVQ